MATRLSGGLQRHMSLYLPLLLLHSLLFLQRAGQSCEWAPSWCSDTSVSLMRIRNILIKTHNPPLNPSLQNHLHSAALLPSAARRWQISGPLLYFPSSLTQGNVSLCLPSVSVIFDPLSLDFQTRWARRKKSAFVCTSISCVWNGKWDICLMRRRWTGTWR